MDFSSQIDMEIVSSRARKHAFYGETGSPKLVSQFDNNTDATKAGYSIVDRVYEFSQTMTIFCVL